MTVGAAPVAVRSMDGPFVARRCVRSARGYRWIEQTLAPGDYLDAAQLQAIAKVVPTAEVRPPSDAVPASDAVASLPELLRPDLAVWRVLPSPALLCDTLFGAPSQVADGRLERVCEALGTFLGHVHAIRADQVPSLPVRRQAAWLTAASPITEQVAAARTEVIRRSDGVLAAAAVGADRPSRPACLVHGRFSSGLSVVLDRPVVLGWREAGIGDPDRDLAFFLTELVEAAAVGTGGARLSCLARRFLTGYATVAGDFRPDRLPALVADRLLEHYAQGTVAVGSTARIEPVVAAVTGRWQELVRLVGDGDW